MSEETVLQAEAAPAATEQPATQETVNAEVQGQTQEVTTTPAAPVQTVLDGDTAPKVAPESPVTNWKDSLPDELKGMKSIQDFKSVEDLVKSYDHTKSLVGRKVEDLDAETLKAIDTKFGAPESLEAYDFKAKTEEAAEMTDWFKKTAFDAGLPVEKAKAVYEKYNELEQETIQRQQLAVQQQNEEWIGSLKKEFGEAFDERVAIANKALQAYGGDELENVLAQAGLANHPPVVKALVEAGKPLMEGQFAESSKPVFSKLSPSEAADKVRTLRSDPDFMKHYKDSTSPKHQEYRQELNNLYKIQAMGA